MSAIESGYRLPETLRSRNNDQAVAYLQQYFGSDGGGRYSGSYFDEWALPQDPDVFTADDLVAVSFLSVFVPPLAARRLLLSEREQFTQLLADIGPDRDLATESQTIDARHPMRRLNSALEAIPGVGPTIASKLIARKRPKLVPIYDSVVARVTNAWSRQWEPLRLELQRNGAQLHSDLLALGERANLDPRISVLRIYDVITWMEGKAKSVEPEGEEERLGAALANLGDPA